jgi:1-acyl-sn-glycerol-3-phosphate acyltransferase
MPRRLYYTCGYWFSLLVFGAVSLGLNAACAFLLLMPGRSRRGPAVREAIRRLFARWTRWLNSTNLVTVNWHGLGDGPLPRSTVYIANHPSLIDATLILDRLPDAVCIFKPELGRNPFLAAAAVMAEYGSGGAGIDLVRDLAAKVASGCSALIFPEGTRTGEPARFHPLKPGFAAIAKRAKAPVQVLILKVDRELLPSRSRSWWRTPKLPVHFDIHVDRRIPYDPDTTVDHLVAEVEGIFAERLGAP